MAIEGVEKVKRSTLAEGVIGRIREMIENGRIKPGERLPAERELAGLFGVGRSSVREALRVLQAVGALDRKQGVGTRLSKGARESLRRVESGGEKYTFMELTEARKLIEVQMAELSAENADKEDILAMKTACEKHADLFRSGLSSEIAVLDYDFHRAVAQGAHNRFLLTMFDILRENLVFSNYAVLTEDKVTNAISYHKQLLNAVKTHNPERAKTIMEEHLLQVEKNIIQSYENGEEDSHDRTGTALERVKA